MTPSFDLTNYPDPVVNYDLSYDFESCCDHGYFQFSLDEISNTSESSTFGSEAIISNINEQNPIFARLYRNRGLIFHFLGFKYTGEL